MITITNLQFIFSNSPEAPTYIWSIYLSVDDTIYQILWFLSEFPQQRVIANKEAEEPRVSSDQLRKRYGRRDDLVHVYGIYVSILTIV